MVTTAPEATTVFSPMVTPGLTITPAPSHTLSPRTMGLPNSSPDRRVAGSVGWPAVVRQTLGASRHPSPMVTAAEGRFDENPFPHRGEELAEKLPPVLFLGFGGLVVEGGEAAGLHPLRHQLGIVGTIELACQHLFLFGHGVVLL